jgi:hypothetical protein
MYYIQRVQRNALLYSVTLDSRVSYGTVYAPSGSNNTDAVYRRGVVSEEAVTVAMLPNHMYDSVSSVVSEEAVTVAILTTHMYDPVFCVVRLSQ